MGLPSGYKRLRYIQSSGTQYINTGFKPNQDTRVFCDVVFVASSTAHWLFGARNGNQDRTFGFLTYDNKYRSDYNTSTNEYLTGVQSGRFTVDKDRNVTKINGQTAKTATVGTFQCTHNLYLLANNNNGTVGGQCTATMYSCKIYNNGVLVRDFIPCQKPDGTIGLWDDVNSVFYGNAGNGTFTAGPIVVSQSEVIELEYIESSGTQYVNTGFKPNNNSRVVLDFEPTASYSSIVGIFGTRDTKSATAAKMFVFWNNGARTFRTDYFGTQKTMTIPMLLARQTVDKDKNVTTIGSVSVSNTVSTGQCSNNLYLFCTNNAGTAQYFAKLKLYSCKIYDNGTIIRDYIPAKLSDGTVGLYDKLNGLLYINVGTGTFISGGYALNLPVNIGGTWKDANEAFVNIGGTWKTVEAAFANIDGTWKELG